jgi:hypothetical protein
MMKRRTFAAVTLAGIALLTGLLPGRAYDPERKVSAKHLRRDLELMGTALREAHGALDRYLPRAEWERRFTAALARIDRPMSEREFFLLAAPLVTAIGCGHTSIHPSYAWQQAMRSGMPLFPFKLAFVDGVARVQRNYSQLEGLPLGGEVVAINGMPLGEIIGRMLVIVPGDANIRSVKLAKLESTFYFGTCYNLLFGRHDEYETALRLPGRAEVATVRAAGIRAADLDAVFRQRYPAAAAAADTAPIRLEVSAGDPPALAVLTIRTFNVGEFRRAGVSYPAFLSRAFQELDERRVQTLLIDLRYNDGGDDAYGKVLVAHLLDKPFEFYRSVEVRPPRYSFWKHSNRPASVIGLRSHLSRNERGGYDVADHPNLGWQQPQPPVFAGRVYVLINGFTFSAAGECASVLHFRRRARFIGSECGAAYAGNTSGLGLVLTLPHSGIRLGIPLCKITLAVRDVGGDGGLVPDVPYRPSVAEVLSEADAELAFALDVIARETRRP